jgi:antitoxin CcdA
MLNMTKLVNKVGKVCHCCGHACLRIADFAPYALTVYLCGMVSEHSIMKAVAKRKTSLTLDADALDSAKELGINISAVAEAALVKAIAEARQQRWLEENADAFAEQTRWHKCNGHPLAEIMTGPGGASWTS